MMSKHAFMNYEWWWFSGFNENFKVVEHMLG